MGVMFLDKERIKELLYRELELSLDIAELIEKLKAAGRDLKIFGERLENNPAGVLLSDEFPQPVISISGETGKGPLFNLKAFGEQYDREALRQTIILLKCKQEELEEVRRYLYPVRAKLER